VFEGYLVTPCAEVWSLKTSNPKLLSQRINRCGYREVRLTAETQKVSRLVHRMVALTFLPNPNGHPVVNHIDGNKLNNHRSNLEWVTHADNMVHANYMGHSGVSPKRVLQIDGTSVVRAFFSINEASRETGIHAYSISKCCQKAPGRKTAGGFRWEFAEKG
jgi:hypothetical protein